jgi:hypothetical protein
MYHLTNAQLLVGILALLLAAVLVVRAILADRKEKSAPFRNYFGSGYQRELLRHSDLSESEDWRADRQSRSTPFRLRGLETQKRRSQANGGDAGDHESE